MNAASEVRGSQPRLTGRIGQTEFVALVALVTAIGALSIDAILPAFPQIRTHLGLAPDSKRVSLLVTSYLLGMGLGQIPAGVLSDRLGRKRALRVFLAIYVIGVGLSAVTPSLGLIICARIIAGFGSAGPRAISMAIVRDLYTGVRMAQILSYIQSVFVIVPVLAPSAGSLMLHLGGWRTSVLFPAVVAIGLAIWLRRLSESLPIESRRRSSVADIRRSIATLARHRTTRFYSVALALFFGNLSAYISLSEQIVDGTYHRKAQFPLIFGAIAASMGVSTLLNAKLVGRFGLETMVRRMPLMAMTLSLGLAIISTLTKGHPSIVIFAVGMAMLLCVQTLVVPNVNTLAMATHGSIAGVAAGAIGTVATIGGAVFGTIISQAHDGTTRTLFIGIACLLVAANACVRIGQRATATDQRVEYQ